MKNIIPLFALPFLLVGCVNNDTDTQIKMNCALGFSRKGGADNVKEYAQALRRITGFKDASLSEVSAFCKEYRNF